MRDASRRRSTENEVDLIVIGSGAAGLTAAVSAALEGLSCVVLEHRALLGGTSARSSGTVWIPDNAHMRAAGIAGDGAAAETYLSLLAGARGDPAIRQAYVERAPAMEADLAARAGIGFRPFRSAPDYCQELPGAAPGWRALEPLEFDGRKLGADFAHLAPPLPEMLLPGGVMVTRAEAAQLLRADRSTSALGLALRLAARGLRDRVKHRRGTRLVLGNALVARLLHAAIMRGVKIRRNVDTARLLQENRRIVGVQTVAGEVLRARRGVVLAGGGFPADPGWRARELPAPTPMHTPASPGCVGATLELGLAAGAVLGPSGEDNALWFPSSIAARRDGSVAVWPHIVLDRAKPGAIVVDRTGRRFANEAASYHEFCRAMHRANGGGAAIPAVMICDRAFIRRYGLGLIRPRALSIRRHVRSGYLTEAPRIADLARRLDMDPAALADTVARFNRFAVAGRDLDFQRGETIYERANGDAGHGPNPCLGPIGAGPVYGLTLHPTPLGTSRGLAADRRARALDAQGAPIAGLHVCGNDMQSAFGGEYPGAGAQLGQGMTFGWIAARDAAGTE